MIFCGEKANEPSFDSESWQSIYWVIGGVL